MMERQVIFRDNSTTILQLDRSKSYRFRCVSCSGTFFDITPDGRQNKCSYKFCPYCGKNISTVILIKSK